MKNSMDNLDMNKYLESEAKRRRFDEVSDEEQIERFLSLRSLFANKEELTKEEDIERANYFDFFENINNATGLYKVEGLNSVEVKNFLIREQKGNRIIKKALDYYLEVRKNLDAKLKKQEGREEKMDEKQIELDNLIDFDRLDLAANSTEGRKLYVDKLKELFQESLGIFVNGGGKIGRKPPEMKEEEKKALAEDLEDILKHVNQYR